MANFRQHGNLEVEGLEVQAFPDVAPITLQKRKQFKFLRERLIKEGIWYLGSFPFRLLVEKLDKKSL